MQIKDNKVIVTHGNGPLANAKNALAGLDLTSIKDNSVLIKPNMGRAVGPGKGINTHPEAITGVIEALREAGVTKIAIGESPILGVNALDAFKKSGVHEIAKKYDCELIDMDSIQPVVLEINQGRILESTKVCAHVFQYDIILSLPVAKCHMHTGVTLGIKNLKGCLYRREKVRYHQLEYLNGKEFPDKTLDSAISDLATVLLPNITVVDGYIGMQGLGPSGGETIESNFAVASFHPMGADVIACQMMGLNPNEISHLKLIAERIKMPIDPDFYQVTPVDYLNYQSHYKQPPQELTITYPDVRLVDKESCSACLSTVMLFLKRFKNDMTPYLQKDGLLHLAIGKGIKEEDINNETILIGNCTNCIKNKGIYISGCPPVPTRIYKEITGEDPFENEPEISN